MIAVEAVAVHLDMLVLFIVLLVLALAIVIIGGGLLSRRPRPHAPRTTRHETFEDVARVTKAVPPFHAPFTQEHQGNESPPSSGPDAPQRPEILARPTRNAAPTPPEKVAFSTIQDEIRAALGAATRDAAPQSTTDMPVLQWLEPGRLAVLSLNGAAPESVWSLLQSQGIHILVTPETHPFPTPNRAIELLCLPSRAETAIPPLATKLRAKLAKGERIAFYGESRLHGPIALLADRLASHEGQ